MQCFVNSTKKIGLEADDVDVLGVTSDWLRYRLPDKFIRRASKPLCHRAKTTLVHAAPVIR